MMLALYTLAVAALGIGIYGDSIPIVLAGGFLLISLSIWSAVLVLSHYLNIAIVLDAFTEGNNNEKDNE